jgi:uncharacterized protein
VATSDARATVDRFMQALMAERFDEARGLLLHDDFVVHEAGGVPYSGEYRGPQGFFELFAKMNEDLELAPDPAVQYLLADLLADDTADLPIDDTVAIRYRLKFTARASGRSVEMSLVEIYTVRAGLITELDVYYKDPSAVAALLAT